MQFIFDHLTALVVSTTALFIFVGIMARGQDATMSGTLTRAARTDGVWIMSAIERDLLNIGAGLAQPGTAIQAYDPNGSLTFSAPIEKGGPNRLVRYGWAVVDSFRTVVGTGPWIPLYRVERSIDGKVNGVSTGKVRTFSMVLLNGGGVPVTTNLADTRAVKVAVRTVVNIGKERYRDTGSWAASYYPRNLRRG